jgi:hypothetical protein
MSEAQCKHVIPSVIPYFDYAAREQGALKRFWIAENGFPSGRSFDTLEQAVADVTGRRHTGLQYQIYDGDRHEWVFVTRSLS